MSTKKIARTHKPSKQAPVGVARKRRAQTLSDVSFWTEQSRKYARQLAELKSAVTVQSFRICSGIDRSDRLVEGYLQNSGEFDAALKHFSETLEMLSKAVAKAEEVASHGA